MYNWDFHSTVTIYLNVNKTHLEILSIFIYLWTNTNKVYQSYLQISIAILV